MCLNLQTYTRNTKKNPAIYSNFKSVIVLPHCDPVLFSFSSKFEVENKRLFTEMNSLVDEVRYDYNKKLEQYIFV